MEYLNIVLMGAAIIILLLGIFKYTKVLTSFRDKAYNRATFRSNIHWMVFVMAAAIVVGFAIRMIALIRRPFSMVDLAT